MTDIFVVNNQSITSATVATTELVVVESVKGVKGDKGDIGEAGQNGLSAYQVAVANGFIGSEAQWLDSLKGDGGISQAVNALGENNPIAGVDYSVANVKSVLAEDLVRELKTTPQIFYYIPLKAASIPPNGIMYDVNSFGQYIVTTYHYVFIAVAIGQFDNYTVLSETQIPRPLGTFEFESRVTLTIRGSASTQTHVESRVDIRMGIDYRLVDLDSAVVDLSNDCYLLFILRGTGTDQTHKVKFLQSVTNVYSQPVI